MDLYSFLRRLDSIHRTEGVRTRSEEKKICRNAPSSRGSHVESGASGGAMPKERKEAPLASRRQREGEKENPLIASTKYPTPRAREREKGRGKLFPSPADPQETSCASLLGGGQEKKKKKGKFPFCVWGRKRPGFLSLRAKNFAR